MTAPTEAAWVPSDPDWRTKNPKLSEAVDWQLSRFSKSDLRHGLASQTRQEAADRGGPR